MKFLVLGHAQHGKDTVKDYVARKCDLKCYSASSIAVELFIYPALYQKYKYKTYGECYDDRHDHRQEWADLWEEYCKDDKGRFVREALSYTDGYAGLRHRDQYDATQKLFDIIFWVDACKRKPLEPTLELCHHDADVFLDNNHSVEYLYRQIDLAVSTYERGELCQPRKELVHP